MRDQEIPIMLSLSVDDLITIKRAVKAYINPNAIAGTSDKTFELLGKVITELEGRS